MPEVNAPINAESSGGGTSTPSSKSAQSCYLFRSGKELGDYIAESGFALGFGIGNAVRLCFKAGQTNDPDERKRHMDGCTYYINYAARHTKTSRDEIANIVAAITSRIEKDAMQNI